MITCMAYRSTGVARYTFDTSRSVPNLFRLEMIPPCFRNLKNEVSYFLLSILRAWFLNLLFIYIIQTIFFLNIVRRLVQCICCSRSASTRHHVERRSERSVSSMSTTSFSKLPATNQKKSIHPSSVRYFATAVSDKHQIRIKIINVPQP